MPAVHQNIPAEVVQYLSLHHIITLSTSSFTGRPHANTVAFASDDQYLYFYGKQDSILGKNIRDNRHVSFTVDDYTQDWRKVRELQGVGACALANEHGVSRALMLMRNKFGKEFSPPEGDLYVISPNEMHFVDFDYTKVAGAPEMHVQSYQLVDEPTPEPIPMSAELERRTFAAGTVIFSPAQAKGDYYVVLDGEVEIRAEGHGADQTVVRVGPGGMFGDRAALGGQKGQLTAHAVQPTILLTVERSSIRDLATT